MNIIDLLKKIISNRAVVSYVDEELVGQLSTAIAQLEAEQPQTLDEHAQVDAATFGPGVSWKTVIECAQRNYVAHEEARNRIRAMTREDKIAEEMNRREFFDNFYGIESAAANSALVQARNTIDRLDCRQREGGQALHCPIGKPCLACQLVTANKRADEAEAQLKYCYDVINSKLVTAVATFDEFKKAINEAMK